MICGSVAFFIPIYTVSVNYSQILKTHHSHVAVCMLVVGWGRLPVGVYICTGMWKRISHILNVFKIYKTFGVFGMI